MKKRNLMVVGLAVLLSACGFQLRGTGDTRFAITEINVQARNAFGETVEDVRSALAEHLKVHAGAPYTLVLLREDGERRAASYSNAGRSSEYQINNTLEYEIQNADKLPLMSNKVEVQRFYAHDNNNIVGSGEEANQLKEEMRRETVQQLVQQLQVLTPARLQSLEQEAKLQAQAREQAEQEALRQRQSQPLQSPVQLPIQR